jgi:hypothetical protein
MGDHRADGHVDRRLDWVRDDQHELIDGKPNTEIRKIRKEERFMNYKGSLDYDHEKVRYLLLIMYLSV